MIRLPGNSYTMTPLPSFVKVGHFSSIGSDVKFHSLTHLAEENHNCVYTTNFDQPNELKIITIGHDAWIGDGVRILDGITIGNGAIIGAGAVIGSDVPPFTVAVGNPWRVVRKRFTDEQIEKLENIGWWWWSEEEVKERLHHMKDINEFLKQYE